MGWHSPTVTTSPLDVPEAGGDVGGEHLVPLLEPVVLDVVQVIPPDGASPVHLQGGDDAGQDPAPDADVAGEGALLVDVFHSLGIAGGLDAEADGAGVPGGLFALVELVPDQV